MKSSEDFIFKVIKEEKEITPQYLSLILIFGEGASWEMLLNSVIILFIWYNVTKRLMPG